MTEKGKKKRAKLWMEILVEVASNTVDKYNKIQIDFT